MKIGRQKMWALLIFVGTIVLFFLIKDRLVRYFIYPVPAVSVPEKPPANFEPVELSTPDGEKISGWFHRKNNSDKILLYFHGNGENLVTIRHSGLPEHLVRLNISFIIWDYPGYGQSSGSPSEKKLVSAANVLLDWVNLRFSNHKVILMGWSLGAAVALQAAANSPDIPDKIILLSAWSSLQAVAQDHYPEWLVRPLLRETYDSVNAIKNLALAVLIVHGGRDRIIPADHARLLRENAPHGSRLSIIPAAAHNDLLSYPEVWENIRRFLQIDPRK